MRRWAPFYSTFTGLFQPLLDFQGLLASSCKFCPFKRSHCWALTKTWCWITSTDLLEIKKDQIRSKHELCFVLLDLKCFLFPPNLFWREQTLCLHKTGYILSDMLTQFGYVSALREKLRMPPTPPWWKMLESSGARTGWEAIWAKTAACLRILSAAGTPAWAAAAREIIVLSLLQAPCLLLVKQTGPFMRQEERFGGVEGGWMKRLERWWWWWCGGGCWDSGLRHWAVSYRHDSCAGRRESVFHGSFCGGGSQSGGCINLCMLLCSMHVCVCVCAAAACNCRGRRYYSM